MPQGNSRGASSSAWARWRELSSYERRATIAAAALIPVVAASLRIFGAHRTIARFARRRQQPVSTDDETTVARWTGHAVMRAGRWGIYKGNCLSRSIALMHLLGRRGIAADLRFGARTREQKFEAHAWVEHERVPLNDATTVRERFSPLAASPSDSEARRA